MFVFLLFICLLLLRPQLRTQKDREKLIFLSHDPYHHFPKPEHLSASSTPYCTFCLCSSVVTFLSVLFIKEIKVEKETPVQPFISYNVTQGQIVSISES